MGGLIDAVVDTEGNSRKPEKKRIRNAKLNMNTTVMELMDFDSMMGRKWQLGLAFSLSVQRERETEVWSTDLNAHGN